MSNLKHKTVVGFIWSFIERFSQQGIQFVVILFLARLLVPAQFGLIGMITIFIAISQTLLDSGFSQALIQKKEPTKSDYSTVFYFNIFVGLILYLLLFITAPFIASFYNQPELTSITRVISLSIIINSFGLIQNTILTKRIDFKTLTKVSIISTILSGTISISMAYNGYGVWSLVFQSLSITLFRTITIWIYNKWYPTLEFNFKALKKLFSYGSLLMISGLIDTIFQNIYLLIIGKIFSPASLGFYAQAKKWQELPVKNLNNMVQRVTFSSFSTIQDDDIRLKNNYKKTLKALALVNFPLMLSLMVIAKPLILITITSRWLPAVPYFQLLCIIGLLYPIQSLNLNIIIVKGRSDLFLKLEIIKKILVIAAILISISYGITGLIIGQIITTFISFYINTHYSGRFINYGVKEQIIDLLPYFLVAIIMATTMHISGSFFASHYLTKLVVQILIGGSSFFVLLKLFKINIHTEVLDVLKPLLLGKLKSKKV